MHDAALVGVLEPRRDLSGDRQRLVHRQRAPRQPLREVLALDQLEREREDSVRLLEPVDRADPRMVERGEDLRLAAEPGQALRLIGDLGREDLEGDVAPELEVAGAEHLSHPARADRVEDLVVPDSIAWAQLPHQRMSRGCPVEARTLDQSAPSGSIFLRSDTASRIGTCVKRWFQKLTTRFVRPLIAACAAL